MPLVVFTNNLKRHIECPAETVEGITIREVLDNVFENNKKLATYVLDDQGRLRQHMLILVDGVAIKDKTTLSDPVQTESEVYVLQALSGG